MQICPALGAPPGTAPSPSLAATRATPGSVDHQRKGDSTLGATVPLGPYQRHPHRCTTDSPPRLAPAHSHRCLASRRGPLPLGPRPDAGAPGTRPPLPAPGGKVRGWDSGTPLVKMPRPEIFSKNHSRENTPPGDGTRHQHFIYGRLAGPYCRRFKHFTAPLGLPMDTPFAGRGGAVSGSQPRRFIFPGERSWGGFHGAGAPGGARLARRRGRHPGPISTCLQLPVSALFARVPIYER